MILRDFDRDMGMHALITELRLFGETQAARGFLLPKRDQKSCGIWPQISITGQGRNWS